LFYRRTLGKPTRKQEKLKDRLRELLKEQKSQGNRKQILFRK
jgi:hypothetical protein